MAYKIKKRRDINKVRAELSLLPRKDFLIYRKKCEDRRKKYLENREEILKRRRENRRHKTALKYGF